MGWIWGGNLFSQSTIITRQLKCRTLVHNMHKIKYETRRQVYFMRANRTLIGQKFTKYNQCFQFSSEDYAIRL